jgi:HSP20 family molecular chaperone IbpA
MENVNVSVERVHPYRPMAGKTTDHSKVVRRLFVELVQHLERLKDSPVAKSNGGSLERWEDDENIYLETELSSVFASEIDVNVHDGRVYVRLAR